MKTLFRNILLSLLLITSISFTNYSQILGNKIIPTEIGEVIPTWSDIGDATFDSSSTVVVSEGWKAYGFIFNSDGTKFWSIDNGTDIIYQYSLSTAYDPTTITYDSVSLSVASQVSDPTGIAINDTDDRLYVGGNGIIQEYDLSTANDLSTASTGNSFSIVGGWKIFGLKRNADGTKFWGTTDATGGGTDTMHEWDLSTPYDITTAVLGASQAYNSPGVLYDALVFPDGSHVLALDSGTDKLCQYLLNTSYDIEDPDYAGGSPDCTEDSVSTLDVSGKEATLNCMWVDYEGTMVFILGNSNKKLHKYTW